MSIILLLMCGYVFGSISFAALVSKAKGIDVFKVGTTNPGAANVYRQVGKRYGILVWALDTIKGIVPMVVSDVLGQPLIVIAAVGASAIAGHCFSIFLKFKGGKGAATMGGVILYLFPVLFPAGAILYLWVQRKKRNPAGIYTALLIFLLLSVVLYRAGLVTFRKNFLFPSKGLEIVIAWFLLFTVDIIANIPTIKEITREFWGKRKGNGKCKFV